MPTPDRSRSRRSHVRGFSLVELLVVIAIIAVISGVTLAEYKSYSSAILLRNLAYEIALSTREAQVLGISVRGEGGSFRAAYGMHFTTGAAYTLFRDANDNKRYDDGEAVSLYTIGHNNRITAVCLDADTNCPLLSFAVLFRRPEPDALFYNATGTAVSAGSVSVAVGAPDGRAHAVRIWTTGQIAVE